MLVEAPPIAPKHTRPGFSATPVRRPEGRPALADHLDLFSINTIPDLSPKKG